MKKRALIFGLLFVGYSCVAQLTNPAKPMEANKNTITNKIPEMVTIQGGSFKMGSKDGDADEKPMHQVTLASYKMGKYEVTFNEFAAFIEATNYKTDADKQGYSYTYNPEWEKKKGVNWQCGENGEKRTEKDANKPVIHVSWNDATAYCQWLSRKTGKTYRLPTEAEWEYAAGNGAKHTKYSWGDKVPETGDKVADSKNPQAPKKYLTCSSKFEGNKNSCFFSSDVGSYAANELGLYDISGNVWEWCSDWYDKGYYSKSEAKNPKGPANAENKAIRGASWVYDQASSRVAYRSNANPTLRNYNIGFRVVCVD